MGNTCYKFPVSKHVVEANKSLLHKLEMIKIFIFILFSWKTFVFRNAFREVVLFYRKLILLFSLMVFVFSFKFWYFKQCLAEKSTSYCEDITKGWIHNKESYGAIYIMGKLLWNYLEVKITKKRHTSL